MTKTLIIAPHVDDEVLGCFSVLNNSFVLYCGMDETNIQFNWVKERPSTELRYHELDMVQQKHEFQYEVLNNKVNYYTIQDILPNIERIINKIQPEEIYIPVPSYNQDHRIVYEAALTALRPHDINHFVKKVLVYEQIQDLWNHNYHKFNPIYFKRLDIEDKIKTYKLMQSQVRAFRSPEMITNLASIRGIQSNMQYAEGFEIIRWID